MTIEREAFETWMLNDEKWIVGSNDLYAKHGEEDRWRCWQAAWKAASVPAPDVQAQIDAARAEERARMLKIVGAELDYCADKYGSYALTADAEARIRARSGARGA